MLVLVVAMFLCAARFSAAVILNKRFMSERLDGYFTR